MTVLESAIAAPWAMLPENLDTLLTIAARENVTSPEALEAYKAQFADRGERLQVRDGVGILNVQGPLFKGANLFVKISGATSYEILRRDLQAALDDPAVNAIMLRVDSPGGEANGCDELAQAIYEARAVKPVHAFVSGMACSGGYWLASAAEKVIVSDLAVLGSIGVVLGVTDRRKADERNGVHNIEFVSSQSPGKRPDVATDEGRGRIQKMVDDLAEVFVSAVAKHRGVKPETVIQKFGAGGVEVGAKAVALGMADEVGGFEAAFKALSTRGSSRRIPQRSNGGFLMSDKTNATVEDTIDVAKIQAEARSEGSKSERARIEAILGSDEAKTRKGFATHLAFKTAMPVAEAVEMLKAAAEETPAQAAAPTNTQSYEERKADAGALGLAVPEARGAAAAADAQAGWRKAADAANARFGKDAV